jgi:hypothetical protein
LAGSLLLSACGGSDDPTPPTADNSTMVAVSGTIEFQRIVFNPGGGNGLNGAAPVTAAARGIVVEALTPGDRVVLDRVTTDANGAYSLTVPSNTMILISAKAQMLKTGTAPTWNVQILNNTNEDALYTLESSTFNSGSSAISNRNLLASTGFSGSSYTSTRAAAPFAILDTVFTAQQLLVSADANLVFPALNVFWSDQNRTTGGQFCIDSGDIGTSFYLSQEGSDDCAPQVGAGGHLHPGCLRWRFRGYR